MSYKFPPEDRAELVRLMGEGGADDLAKLVSLARADCPWPSADPEFARLLCREGLRRQAERAAGGAGTLDWARGWTQPHRFPDGLRGLHDLLDRTSRLAFDLAELLDCGPVQNCLTDESKRSGMYWWVSASAGSRPSKRPFVYPELRQDWALGELRDRLLVLAQWAAEAAPESATGRPKDPARHVLLWAVIGACDSAGVRRATGDTAALVKVARIAFRHAEPDQGQWGDPRDMLRALKAAGDLQQRPEAGDEQREEVEGE